MFLNPHKRYYDQGFTKYIFKASFFILHDSFHISGFASFQTQFWK